MKAARILAWGLAAASLMLTLGCQDRKVSQGAPWKVDAPRSAHWTLSCTFAWVRLSNDPYNSRNYVNQMAQDGAGPKAGHLLGKDGRCTLTKTGGRGAVRLTMVKDGVEQTKTTDTGQPPAYVAVY